MKNVFLTAIIMASSGLFAQVKVGTNPTVLATNANFQVEGTTTADQFVVLKNGNVGIGTAAPTNRLSVAGFGFDPAVNDRAAIKVDGGYGGGIVFSEGINRSSIYSNSGSALVFTTGGSASGLPERMRIDATGNLGIGTTVPTQKLDVAGNVKFSGALMPNNIAGTAGQMLISSGAVTAPLWSTPTTANTPNIYSADGTLAGNRTVGQGANSLNFTGSGVTTFNSGNIGMGITTPSQKLEVIGNILLNLENSGFGVDANPIARLGFVKKSGASPVIASSAGSPIIFSQSDQTGVLVNISSAVLTERMRIDSNGFVGIGNYIPTQKLDVVGNVKLSGALMPNNTAGTAGQILTSAGPNVAPIWVSASNLNIPEVISILSFLPVQDPDVEGTDYLTPISSSLHRIIKFTNEVLDKYNSYNPATYEFTAPKSGFYSFNQKLGLQNEDITLVPAGFLIRLGVSIPYTTTLGIVDNSKYSSLTTSRTFSDAGFPENISNSNTIFMSAGQKVQFLTRYIDPTKLTLRVGTTYAREKLNQTVITFLGN